jgi:subtilase family serine protease
MRFYLMFIACALVLPITGVAKVRPVRGPIVTVPARITVSPAAGLPDLVIVSVDSDNLDAGVVKVTVKNQGPRRANPSRIQLTMTWGTKTTNFAGGVPSLPPAATYTVAVDVKLSLVQAKYCAYADFPKKVTESDENNNKLCAQFDGKP